MILCFSIFVNNMKIANVIFYLFYLFTCLFDCEKMNQAGVVAAVILGMIAFITAGTVFALNRRKYIDRIFWEKTNVFERPYTGDICCTRQDFATTLGPFLFIAVVVLLVLVGVYSPMFTMTHKIVLQSVSAEYVASWIDTAGNICTQSAVSYGKMGITAYTRPFTNAEDIPACGSIVKYKMHHLGDIAIALFVVSPLSVATSWYLKRKNDQTDARISAVVATNQKIVVGDVVYINSRSHSNNLYGVVTNVDYEGNIVTVRHDERDGDEMTFQDVTLIKSKSDAMVFKKGDVVKVSKVNRGGTVDSVDAIVEDFTDKNKYAVLYISGDQTGERETVSAWQISSLKSRGRPTHDTSAHSMSTHDELKIGAKVKLGNFVCTICNVLNDGNIIANRGNKVFYAQKGEYFILPDSAEDDVSTLATPLDDNDDNLSLDDSVRDNTRAHKKQTTAKTSSRIHPSSGKSVDVNSKSQNVYNFTFNNN